MKITTLPNGNLSIQAGDPLEQRAIARMRNKQTALNEARFVKRFLRQYGYKTIKPEDCGDEDAIDGFRKAFHGGERDLEKLMQCAFETWLKAAQADCEHQNSDAAVDESITANGYTFTEAGKRFG